MFLIDFMLPVVFTAVASATAIIFSGGILFALSLIVQGLVGKITLDG